MHFFCIFYAFLPIFCTFWSYFRLFSALFLHTIKKCRRFLSRTRIGATPALATRMLLVVSRTLDHPVPSLQRLLTSGQILLGDEGHLVLGDLREVLRAGSYCCRYSREADTSKQLVSSRTGAALYFLAQVQAVTVRVLGSCYSVRTEQHLGAAVLAVFSRFTERTRYAIDTRAPFYFCHNSKNFC